MQINGCINKWLTPSYSPSPPNLHPRKAQTVPDELVIKQFGSLGELAFSPILTIEPRRRKFHRSIELRLPIPSGLRGPPSDADQNLRLLCSIEEGVARAEWKDMTDSVRPFHIDGKHLVFSTTISARYWLVYGPARSQQQQQQLRQDAQHLYRLINRVPFMGKFVVFAKRRDINRANLRIYCMTDDKEERNLEVQEHYSRVAMSRQVELVDGQRMYLEFAGNLVPVTDANPSQYNSSKAALINEQLSIVFRAFQENRLAFTVQLRELSQEPEARIAFMEDSIKYLSSLTGQQREYLHQNSRRAICRLAIQLPQMCLDYQRILGTPRSNSRLASSARVGDLTLAEVARLLDHNSPTSLHPDTDSREDDSLDAAPTDGQRDWIELAPRLGIPRDEVEYINEHAANQAMSQSLLLLMHWYQLSNEDTRDQDLARALISIGRHDIVQRLNFPVEPKRMSRSTMELLHEIDLIPVQSHENLHQQGSNSNLSYSGARKDNQTDWNRSNSELNGSNLRLRNNKDWRNYKSTPTMH